MRFHPARLAKPLLFVTGVYVVLQLLSQRDSLPTPEIRERVGVGEAPMPPLPGTNTHINARLNVSTDTAAVVGKDTLNSSVIDTSYVIQIDAGKNWPDQTYRRSTTAARWQAPEKCPPDMHYMMGDNPKTALPSPPGAGNTWVRHLLQVTTGIYTGSIYQDGQLKAKGFKGEGKQDKTVIAVKMHESGPAVHNKYDRAVVIVRNPYDTIIAEFNRQHGGHTKTAKPEAFRGKRWENHVAQQHLLWILVLRPWLVDYDAPVHIVNYDRLKTDLRSEVHTMINFLGWNITQTQLDCAATNSEGHFHRKKDPLTHDPFDAKTRRILDYYHKLVNEWPANRNNRTAWFDVMPAHW